VIRAARRVAFRRADADPAASTNATDPPKVPGVIRVEHATFTHAENTHRGRERRRRGAARRRLAIDEGELCLAIGRTGAGSRRCSGW
jgi:hypothetical protein